MIVNINGTLMWQNKDGTLDEIPIRGNPKVIAWFAKALKTKPSSDSSEKGKTK